jgi:hypothetical protein
MTEPLIILVLLLLLVVWVVLPIWTILKILGLKADQERQDQEIGQLRRDTEELRGQLRRATLSPTPITPVATPTIPVVVPEPTPTPAPVIFTAPTPVAPLVVADSLPIRSETPTVPNETPPLLPPLPVSNLPDPGLAATAVASETAEPMPPQIPYVPPGSAEPVPEKPSFNWEQFLGAKGFAWAGGAALFLGAVFFVKYSFEHDWIPPQVRAALAFVFGLGLLVAGLKVPRERYMIIAQTLCATGVVCLYAVTFACNSIYHFAFFGPLPTFALMSLITATAFLLAVRLEAQVVAVLGILGGFLTPVLLSTGQDNPAGLFGYLALLNVGLIAVALNRRWSFLVPLGAAGTIIMQLGWADKFFALEKAPVAVVICLAFCALFLAAYLAARRVSRSAPAITWSAIAFPFVAFGFALFFLGYPGIASRPGLLFTFVFLADLSLLAIAWLEDEFVRLHWVAGLAVFAILATWTGTSLTTDLLSWALVFYLVYAVLHTAFPLLLQRYRPETAPTWWSQLFPPLALLLMLGPLFKLDAISLLFWPCLLLVDVLAIGLAMITASLAAVGVVLVLTLCAAGLWIFRVPATLGAMPSLLLVVGASAVLFFVAGIFLSRKLGSRLGAGGRDEKLSGIFGDARAQLPAFAALLPFLLLIMMTQRLPLADPSPVFGLGLLLVVLTLGLAYVLTIEWLPACALAGMAGLEYAWHARHIDFHAPTLPLIWYVGFTLLFAIYPFIFRRRFAALTGPWAVAALGAAVHFPLIYRLITQAWPNDVPGLIPTLFAVVPLLSLVVILRGEIASEKARLNQLAWFGATALLFVTLIFPIQFERQWITISWALEGVALLWLFHRVPHPGLRAMGVLLLVVAFARLTFNHAVLEYHVRGETPILNWYLYSYGLATAALFAGAHLLAPPRERVFGLKAPALLNALGIVLAFCLLNIEIADFFSEPGRRVLAFQFSGNFARDMTYTIAWALFALGLLLVSIWQRTKAGRYAALALLSIALLKLFLHDLSQLGQLYRVAALMAVAAIAIGASFAYQRFLPSSPKTPPAR